MTELNVYQRINEVRKGIEYIKKDASVQGYMAVTHDAVTALTRDLMIQHGIVTKVKVLESRTVDVGKTSKGATIIRYEARYKVSLVNIDKPEERLPYVIDAHANDHGDKAPGKALSYAVKSVLLKVFSIETGVNDEGRLEADKRNKKVIEHLKEEMQEYIDQGDAIAILLMSRKVGEEIWSDLYNSAPDGQKVKFKKQVDEMLATGHSILVEINEAINAGDDLRAKENTNDMSEGGKKMLARELGKSRSEQLGRLVKT